MVIGDIVRYTKTGQEGIIVHITDGCYFVKFDDDPSGCVQIFIGTKKIEKIKGVGND